MQALRAPRPVEAAIGLLKAARIRHAFFGLRREAERAALKRREGVPERLRAQRREAVVQLTRGLVGPDRRLDDVRDRARVEALLHAHHADTRARVAVKHRPLDRGCASPARQQAAMTRQLQISLRQDFTVCDDHAQVGAERREGVVALVRQAGPLEDRQAALGREGRDRWRLHLQPATDGLGRLADDGHDLAAVLEHRGQTGDRELRRTHEDHAQAQGALSVSPARPVRSAQARS